MKKNLVKWGTKSELQYVSRIGETWAAAKKKRITVEEKIWLLEKYIEASEKRTEWKGMDKNLILDHARTTLFSLKLVLK